MLSRVLVVAKYELRQYRGSVVDEAVVALIILAGFFMLVTPEVAQTSLPSSHGIYRVGYLEGSLLGRMSSYTLELMPYSSKYDMISASSLNEIDAFAVYSSGRIVVFGSGTMKSDAALSHLNSIIEGYNSNLVFEYVDRDRQLASILLPLRLRLVEEEIDYTSVLNGSIEQKRTRVLGDIRFVEEDEEPPVTTSDAVSFEPGPQPAPEQLPDAPTPTVVPSQDEDLVLPLDLSIDFPFRTLYRNMTLLSPLLLLSILLALSLSRERFDRTLENLFDSPLTKAEILLGKAVPYLVAMSCLSLVYGLATSLTLDALKVAFVFWVLSVTLLSFGAFSAFVSRSYRELTFIGSFSMFSFFFFIVLPNVFSGVNVLSFISPLDTVTAIENGASIPVTDIVLSLLPYAFLSMFFLTFTGVCFTPELAYSSSGFASLMSAFFRHLTAMLPNKLLYVTISVALLVPFVFIIESILAYLVLPLGYVAPFMSLLLLAVVEEIVKVTPLLHRRMNPVLYGVAAGASFFITEKLFNLYLIVKVYTYLAGPYVFFFKNLAPTFAVHIVATTVFASILHYGGKRTGFILGLAASSIIHFTYNYLLIGGAF